MKSNVIAPRLPAPMMAKAIGQEVSLVFPEIALNCASHFASDLNPKTIVTNKLISKDASQGLYVTKPLRLKYSFVSMNENGKLAKCSHAKRSVLP